MTDLVVLLGAGASIPPLVSQQELVRNLITAPASDRIRPAQSYLRYAFPGASTYAIRFEEIVAPLEIAESEEYWFHFGGSKPGSRQRLTNKEVLDSLDTWVAVALDPDALPKPTKRAADGNELNKEFLHYYAPAGNAGLPCARFLHVLERIGMTAKTAFVSMNYDILLDRAVYASSKYVPDYSIDAFYDARAGSAATEADVTGMLLLKLHGSLNWRVCDSCHILRDLRMFTVWPQSQCIDCGARTARPMLIRPTLLKDFRHRVWRDVWRKAGHVLAAATTWVFIGYSLPLADVWMLRLFAQSARSGGIKPERRRVIIVNTDPAVRERFGLLFPRSEFRQEAFHSWIGHCEADLQ